MKDKKETRYPCEICDLLECTCWCKCWLPHHECMCEYDEETIWQEVEVSRDTVQLLINKISEKIDNDQEIIKKRWTAWPLLWAFDMWYYEWCKSCISLLQELIYKS